jgi:hypothetical protein
MVISYSGIARTVKQDARDEAPRTSGARPRTSGHGLQIIPAPLRSVGHLPPSADHQGLALHYSVGKGVPKRKEMLAQEVREKRSMDKIHDVMPIHYPMLFLE